jgi:N-acetyl-gamma-glutamylphosphate reductase
VGWNVVVTDNLSKPITANYKSDLSEGADRVTHSLHKNDLYQPVAIFTYDAGHHYHQKELVIALRTSNPAG